MKLRVDSPPNCIRTQSGAFVDLVNPQPETIIIEDIAWGLSGVMRWSSQSKTNIPVAVHCLRMLELNHDPNLGLEMLMHDASEFILCDIPSPLKNLLPGYKIIERRLMQVIADKFHLVYPFDESVKTLDLLLQDEEWDNFRYYVSMPSRQVLYETFMNKFNELSKKREKLLKSYFAL